MTRDRHVKLINWATLSQKQRYQISAMCEYGLKVTLLTLDFLGGTSEVLKGIESEVRVVKLPLAPWKRVVLFFREIMFARRGTIIVVPVASKVSFIAVFMGRVRGLKTICVEWGDIGGWKWHPRLLRISMRISYSLADIIWYKEPYMINHFPDSVKPKLFFLPNAVEIPEELENRVHRKIDFLWANRFVNRRRFPILFASAIEQISQEKSVRGVLIGLLPADRVTKEEADEQDYIRDQADDSLEVLDFENPLPLFSNARFFVLIANEVYGNNSLFEAMARGAVPIVTKSPGVEMIIQNGVNGFICELNEASVYSTMRKAIDLNHDEWLSMSESSQLTVRASHNVDQWGENFRKMVALCAIQ